MTILLSEIYDVTLKRGIESAAKNGFIRPTLGENFMTHRDFKEIVRSIPINSVILTGSNLCNPGGIITASSYYGSDDRWYPRNAFDGKYTYSDSWSTEITTDDHWITYDFEIPTVIRHYKLVTAVALNDHYLRFPAEFIFRGSNNNVDWVKLDTRHDQSYGPSTITQYSFDNDKAYRYYGLITNYEDGLSRSIIISEIQMFSN